MACECDLVLRDTASTEVTVESTHRMKSETDACHLHVQGNTRVHLVFRTAGGSGI